MSTKLGTILADFTTQLATAITIGGTTATLQSATDDDGNALPAGNYFFTLDGSNSNKEHISCALSGTSLTNIQSVSRQGVETAGVVRAHRLGATVSLTDFAHIKFINDIVKGTTPLDVAAPLSYDGVADMTGNDNKLATVAYVKSVTVAGAPDATPTTKGIVKISVTAASPTSPIAVGDNDPRLPTQNENDAMAGTSGSPSSSNKYVTNADTSGTGVVVRASLLKFGGTGADGPLTVSSGNTNIDLGGASTFTKNYSSISITGTGSVTFINPNVTGTFIRILNRGDITLTSSATPMLDASGCGAAGGIFAAAGVDGRSASTSFVLDSIAHNGAAGPGPFGPQAGGAAYSSNANLYTRSVGQLYTRTIYLTPGSGGSSGSNSVSGGGSTVGGASGNGGNGGGVLYIEVAGALTFTTANGISVSGKAGGNGANNGSTNQIGGSGGGGGSCGQLLILCNTITTNTGTVLAKGGDGGSSGLSGSAPGTVTCGIAGAGAGAWGAGGSAGTGGNSTTLTPGGNGTTGGGGGGGGATTNTGSPSAGGTGAVDSGAALITTNLFFT